MAFKLHNSGMSMSQMELLRTKGTRFCGILQSSVIPTHPATRRRGDVVTRSLCTCQRHHSYVSNETPNDVSMERRQDVSMVRLNDILLERREDVSRGRNNNVSLVRLHNISKKSQMKHPTMFHWYVTKTSQCYVSTTSH